MFSNIYPLLLVASLALVSTAAHAQRRDQVAATPNTLAQQPLSTAAAELTRDMSTRLKLNEGQYVKLYQINKTRVNQVALINRDYKNDPGALSTKMSELDSQYQQECSRILTPSQLSQLRPEDQPAQPSPTPTGTGNGLG
ncbi:hypothetical protein [uncultured Hymenobacter sp.]|uniref:hypothetical protein n=1 Tax=uncultured Hymenobacter sp. TaxID=170016 RepID=UPI0035CAB007